MLVSNVNFQIIFQVWYEITRFTTEVWVFWLYSLFDVKSPHWKHLKNTFDTRFKLFFMFIMWTFRLCFLFFVKSHVSNWKHLQDTIDTECKLPCLFLMWTFTSYFQFDMKSHVSQLKFELSDHIPFLMWSHHTWSAWKILWIQGFNFYACF